jgi:hypothetical protein
LTLTLGIWALRGNNISPDALAKAIVNGSNTGGRPRFVLDCAVPFNDWWTIRVSIPESAFKRRHWLVPTAVATLLSPGEYAVDGYSESVLYVTEGENANLRRFINKLAKAGIQPGELFLLNIHACERRIRFAQLNGDDSTTLLENSKNAEISGTGH